MLSSQLLGFGAACLALIVVPGPSVLFIIGQTLAVGRLASIVTIAGNALGAYSLGVAVSLGAGPLLQQYPISLTVIQLLGAAFLGRLGVAAILRRAQHAPGDPAAAPVGSAGLGRALRQGYVVGVTNPKVLIVYAVIMPTFLVRSAQPFATQMIALALVPAVIGLLSDSAWAVFSGAARGWFSGRVERMRMLSVAGGSLMIALAVFLALETL